MITEYKYICDKNSIKMINVLGTEYRILIDNFNTKDLKDANRSGYCFFSIREIHIEDFDTDADWKDESEEAKSEEYRKILRHEIIHAFLHESGLRQNSGSVESWATNEEMVDWIAMQFPKITKVFEELGVL